MSSFSARQTMDLVQIVGAGGGVTLDASARQTIDLIQIAAAAARSGATCVFRGLNARQTMDLVQIAAAGKGHVRFEGDKPGDYGAR